MTMQKRMQEKLNAAFKPVRLEIEDQSQQHAGHAGAAPGGQTHYRVVIVSAAFDGLNRVARQRLVYAAVSEELAERVHALSVSALTPAEDGARA